MNMIDTNLTTALEESLRRNPGKVVARDAEHAMTTEQLREACRSAAACYARSTRQRMVGILLPNCALYPAAIFGAMWAGKVPVLLNPLFRSAELSLILRETGIDALVATQATRRLEGISGVTHIDVNDFLGATAGHSSGPATASADETAVLLYTSGTTGIPKGVPLTHRNLLSNVRSLKDRLRPRTDDVALAVLPMFHAFGLTGLVLGPILMGAEVVFTPRFLPERVVALMAQHQVTAFIGVPSMYRLLARSKAPAEPIARLRYAICGGDALSPSVRDLYRQRFGRDVLEGYGLTETSPVISLNTPEDNRPGTVGRVLPELKVRIGSEESKPLQPEKEGEIQVRGPSVMSGYYQRPNENASAFTADGWFRTGDLGYLDADGYLTVTGRIKEIIVRDGEKIMPREVEEVLERHPKVVEAAVVGEPDPPRGESITAYIVPAGAAALTEELRDFCRGRLADYKVPRRFIIARDFPRGPTGKILKRALKDWRPVTENPA